MMRRLSLLCTGQQLPNEIIEGVLTFQIFKYSFIEVHVLYGFVWIVDTAFELEVVVSLEFPPWLVAGQCSKYQIYFHRLRM